jgi:two-component system KDP operon response regulator KdpE
MSAAPLKVLVIDDEPPIRKLLRMGLSTQGYDILEAANGKAALDLLAREPDLIILDLGLPDIQGHELLRTIRSRNESVPIVVLSSRGDEPGKVQALDLGADDYVTKPFGMEELLARMARRCVTSSRFMASARSFASAICRSTWCAGSSRSATRR